MGARDCWDGNPHIVSVSPDPVEVCPGRTATVTLQTEDDGWTPEGDFSQTVSVESPSVKMSWSKECWISEDESEPCTPASDSHNVTVIELEIGNDDCDELTYPHWEGVCGYEEETTGLGKVEGPADQCDESLWALYRVYYIAVYEARDKFLDHYFIRANPCAICPLGFREEKGCQRYEHLYNTEDYYFIRCLPYRSVAGV